MLLSEQDAKGLGEAFEEVAAIRYEWFEVMFRDNALKFRREVQRWSAAQSTTLGQCPVSISIHTLGWMVLMVQQIRRDGLLEGRCGTVRVF